MRKRRVFSGERQAQLAQKQVEEDEAAELGAAAVQDVADGEQLAAEVDLSLKVSSGLRVDPRLAGTEVKVIQVAAVQLAQEPFGDENLEIGKWTKYLRNLSDKNKKMLLWRMIKCE